MQADAVDAQTYCPPGDISAAAFWIHLHDYDVDGFFLTVVYFSGAR